MDKKHFPLIIGLAIPVLMIIVVAVSIYLPRLFAKDPQYDFIYKMGGDSYSRKIYTVKNGQLVKNKITYPETYKGQSDPMLFLHDIKKNTSREIAFEEASAFRLDPNSNSPDGFKIARGNRSGDIFTEVFSRGSDYRSVYIYGHNISEKLNISYSGYSYWSWYDYNFAGWVLHEEK